MPESRHVLLVEDDPVVRESLRCLIESWGYRVDVAVDGLRGVQRALAMRHYAVIVDLGLPFVDGCEVARQVRAAYQNDVLLVAVTGCREKEARIRMMVAGFDHLLEKPVDPELLRQTLDLVSA